MGPLAVVRSSMATTTALPRASTPWRPLTALVAVAALFGILVAAVPSMRTLPNPPDTMLCPAIWPPTTGCAPEAHLIVVGGAIAVLAIAWLAAHLTLPRLSSTAARTGVVAALAVVALIAWSAARVPQPYFLAWSAF